MRPKVLMIVVLIAVFAAMDRPSFAHHGGTAFDITTPVVLKNAVITEFLWINPHPLIKADYKDDKGNVQPDRNSFIAVAGTNALFHYNAQQTWSLDEAGRVRNVLS